MTINFRTYVNSFTDSKYKEISDVRDEVSGSDSLFTWEEKMFFNDPGIADVDKAKKLAILLLKVKKAEATSVEDKDL